MFGLRPLVRDDVLGTLVTISGPDAVPSAHATSLIVQRGKSSCCES